MTKTTILAAAFLSLAPLPALAVDIYENEREPQQQRIKVDLTSLSSCIDSLRRYDRTEPTRVGDALVWYDYLSNRVIGGPSGEPYGKHGYFILTKKKLRFFEVKRDRPKTNQQFYLDLPEDEAHEVHLDKRTHLRIEYETQPLPNNVNQEFDVRARRLSKPLKATMEFPADQVPQGVFMGGSLVASRTIGSKILEGLERSGYLYAYQKELENQELGKPRTGEGPSSASVRKAYQDALKPCLGTGLNYMEYVKNEQDKTVIAVRPLDELVNAKIRTIDRMPNLPSEGASVSNRPDAPAHEPAPIAAPQTAPDTRSAH